MASMAVKENGWINAEAIEAGSTGRTQMATVAERMFGSKARGSMVHVGDMAMGRGEQSTT